MAEATLWSMVAAIAAVVAISVSGASVLIARKSLQEGHRPLVTARIVFRESGNMGIALGLMITNTGNRPAKDVRLIPNWIQLREILTEAPGRPTVEEVTQCFRETIPILENGESFFARNAFGFLTNQEDRTTWKGYGLTFNIRILYRDFEGKREFEHSQDLKLSENLVFAGSSWDDDDEQPVETALRLAKRAIDIMEKIRDRMQQRPPAA
jgi:hypothetical protein